MESNAEKSPAEDQKEKKTETADDSKPVDGKTESSEQQESTEDVSKNSVSVVNLFLTCDCTFYTLG